MGTWLTVPRPWEEGRSSGDRAVAFLCHPGAYSDHPNHVEVIETNLSWVFLTNRDAYKLKKPKRTALVDFTTVEARRANARREVRLNHRLAPAVYRGVVGLYSAPDGGLRLGRRSRSSETAIDWLVWMVRLPAERRLDVRIRSGMVTADDVARLGRVLVDFYRTARPVPMKPTAYLNCFAQDIATTLAVLTPRLQCPASDQALRSVVAQREFLEGQGDLLRNRVARRRIVEAHGDLRPEHIFLNGPPQIIDALEFSRALRLLDPADELAYLALECDRLGAPWIGRELLAAYRAGTGDEPDARLLAFYRSFRAGLRARLAAARLDEAPPDQRASWLARAAAYLRLATAELPIDAG